MTVSEALLDISARMRDVAVRADNASDRTLVGLLLHMAGVINCVSQILKASGR